MIFGGLLLGFGLVSAGWGGLEFTVWGLSGV